MTTLIRNAVIVDGTEQPRYPGELLIAEGRIAQISTSSGTLPAPSDADVLDVEGLIVTPGFIDAHAHSDLQILLEPDHNARISQGVTTEVLGQDGLSYAPVTDAALPELRAKIAGWNTNPEHFDFSWRTVAEYLDRLDTGIATNVVYLVPHGTLRAMVAGWDDVPLTPVQLDHMCDLLRQALREGAGGLSTGLTYTPAMYADRAEMSRLCQVVAEEGGYFSPHTRSYGKGALDAYKEMIDITGAVGCPLHLTHAVMNFEPNKGRGQEFIDLVDRAIAAGADITIDSYPYLPGATTLSAVLPSWSSAGGQRATLARLQDPDALARIREDLEVNGSDGCHGVTAEWDTLEISGVTHPELESYVGKTIKQIATESSRTGFDVFVDILVRDELGTGILQHVGHEDNVQTIMRHRHHCAGSDGLLVGAKPHPRAWGTFPRYIARYCRDLNLFTLEECIGHLAGRMAKRLRLHDRGFIREGYAADLVVFDADTVADRSTFAEPRLPPDGIHHVFVNGVPALRDGVRTDTLSGRTLRRATDGKLH